jgi:hypothetical protein
VFGGISQRYVRDIVEEMIIVWFGVSENPCILLGDTKMFGCPLFHNVPDL